MAKADEVCRKGIPDQCPSLRLSVAQEQVIDEVLGKRMTLLREIASLGRAARMDAKIKVRQPLASVEVVLVEATHQGWLEEHDEILREELNVKTIGYSCGASPYIEYQVQPNFRMLGPKLGPLLPKVKQALAGANGAQLLAELNENASIRLKLDSQEVVLDGQDIQVRLQAKPGWAAAKAAPVLSSWPPNSAVSLFWKELPAI